MKRLITCIFAAGALVSTESSFAQEQRISGGPWLGCSDKETQSQITKIAVSGDKEAFKKILVQALLSGACVQIKTGQQVYLEDTAIFSGLIKVRPQGKTSGVWTNIEALGKK